MQPSILVMPDTFVLVEINSSILEPWASGEGLVARRPTFRTRGTSVTTSQGTALEKSSGGYGALVRGMLDDC